MPTRIRLSSKFAKQDDTEAFYRPNLRTHLVNFFLPSPFKDNTLDPWYLRIKDAIFGWLISMPVFLISFTWEWLFHRQRLKAERDR